MSTDEARQRRRNLCKNNAHLELVIFSSGRHRQEVITQHHNLVLEQLCLFANAAIKLPLNICLLIGH